MGHLFLSYSTISIIKCSAVRIRRQNSSKKKCQKLESKRTTMGMIITQKCHQFSPTIVQGPSWQSRPPTLAYLPLLIRSSPSTFVRCLQTVRTSPNRTVKSRAALTLVAPCRHTGPSGNPCQGHNLLWRCISGCLSWCQKHWHTIVYNERATILSIYFYSLRIAHSMRESELRLWIPVMVNNQGPRYAEEYKAKS